jgi:hypothetical protein
MITVKEIKDKIKENEDKLKSSDNIAVRVVCISNIELLEWLLGSLEVD